MPTIAEPYSPFTPDGLARWVRAGALTAVVDGLFSSALAAFVYGSGVARLWQGVASTLLTAKAFEGGAETVAIGLVMHVGVAFGWSAVFLFVLMRSSWIRGVLASPWGVLKVTALYGPFIWMVMSLVVIPLLVQRPPSITVRWWVQFVGHIPFVAVPMLAANAPWRR